MTPEQFQHWLRGFLEAAGDKLTEEQTRRIREELAKVQVVAALPWPWPPSPPFLDTIVTCGEMPAGITWSC